VIKTEKLLKVSLLLNYFFQFLYVDIGTEGGSNDAGIFNRSELATPLKDGKLGLPEVREDDELPVPYHLLGDDAFSLTATTMKPFPHRSLDPKERVFNYRFSRARRCVESAFGIMASCFRILRVPITQNYQHAVSTVKAVVVLHNLMLKHHPPTNIEADQTQDMEQDAARPLAPAVRGGGTQFGRL